MGNLGFSELMIILVVCLLVFGAKRLPEIGSSIGKGIREFKRSISDTTDEAISPPDQRAQVPRQLDAPSVPPAPGGEPKRLSQ